MNDENAETGTEWENICSICGVDEVHPHFGCLLRHLRSALLGMAADIDIALDRLQEEATPDI